jgi:large subunit ribosomal protein L10
MQRKQDKAVIVEELREKVGRAQIGVLADFTGLKVDAMTQLRRQVKEMDAELKVAKNTLLKRAAGEESLLSPIAGDLVGPNALALGYADPVALAKLLVKFAQDKPLFKLKGGVLSGQPLSVADLEALSKLPAREVLLAQVLGALNAVPTSLVTVLAGVIRSLLNVLVALKDQKGEGEEEAPAEAAAAASESPVEAATAEETAAPETSEPEPEKV